MTEVLFYHLTESKLEAALPPLLERSLARGWRVIVQSGDKDLLDELDVRLWNFRDDSFLAHGKDSDPHPSEQPILLTMGSENGNGAQVRFLVAAAAPPDLSSYERAVFMFDGHDDGQLQAARNNWRAMKAAGHQSTYWQQTEEGRWERKA